jgi:hypothetical protein
VYSEHHQQLLFLLLHVLLVLVQVGPQAAVAAQLCWYGGMPGWRGGGHLCTQ